MKIFFLVVLFFHGLLHFIGVSKALRPASIPAISDSFSKSEGFLWFTAAILLVGASVACAVRKEWWPIVAIAGVVISQIVIGLSWQEAKYGSLANLIILLVSFNFLSQQRFNSSVNKEVAAVENTQQNESFASSLPPVVQNWLEKSGALDQEILGVHLVQEGRMKMKPDGKWMDFKATEVFNLKDPGFVWQVEVDALPFVKLYGRDMLENGKGAMTIKFYHLINLVNEKDDYKLNSGSMMRYLAEACWFPPAAKASYLKWEQIDENSAKATFTQNSEQVSGVFEFSEDGLVQSFEGMRFFGTGNKAKQEIWRIENSGIKEFHGILIPQKSSIIWKLESGDFHWLELEIKDLQYRRPKRYTAATTKIL